MIPIIGPIFSLLSSGIESYTEVKKTKLKNKAIIEEGEQKRLTKAQDDDAKWEQIMAENQDESWKDEYLTIILTIPLVMAFIPSLAPYVEQGFAVLERVPEWYKIAIGSMIASVFAIRKVEQIKKIWK